MACSVALIVALISPACAQPPRDGTAVSEKTTSDKWTPWSELGGAIGKDGANRGEVTLFAPLQQSATSLFFAEIHGKLFDEDVQEANLALGLRQMQTNGWNLGAWVGYDIRSSEEDNRFHQISGGLEALSVRWDLRVNGYVPLTDPQSTPGLAQVALAGNRIFMTGGEEMALYGFDGEIGYQLLGGQKQTGLRHELRVYGGGFYFDRDDAAEKVAGPRARLEWRIDDIIAALPGSRLTLETEYSNDHSGIVSRADRWELGARLRIPFGGGQTGGDRYASLSAQEQRMSEGIERDIDIVTQVSGEEAVEDAQTDVRFDQVAYADGGTGLTTAIATGGNTLIIADGGNGTIAGFVTVGANQTLQGGASTIPVRGRKTGTVANFTAPGSKPMVQTGGNNDVIIVGGNNVHIAGLTIDGLGQTSDDGIDIVNNKTNIVVDQNMFQNIGEDGFDADFGNSNVRILNNMFTGIADDGIDLEDSNTNFTITGNTIEVDSQNPDGDGIELAFSNSDITISNNTITVAAGAFDGDGIDVFDGNSDITISNNTIMVGAGNVERDGIDIFFRNSGITISGNTITVAASNGGDGIELFLLNSNVTITGNTITATGNNGDAINVDSNNTGIGIASNLLSATGNAGEALDVFFNNSITFNDNSFTGAFNGAVLDFDGNLTTVNGTGNTILPGTAFTNICQGNGNFTGTLEIIDNSTGTPNTVTIVDGGAPCL